MPELSTIIVNWNTRDLTLACLDSVYAQTTATDFETLVVDNGSSDGSASAIAAAFPQVTLLAESKNHGFAKANNLAAERAGGRYFLLLNSDTVVLDGAIDRLMAFARRRPQARIWGGRTVFADGSLNIGSAWGAQTVWSAFCSAAGLNALFQHSNFFNPEGLTGWRRDTERDVDIVSGCFLLIDAALWHQLGGFDPAFFMYGEEADLCRRARLMGARPAVTPEATIIHHGGASGVIPANSIVAICRAKIGLARRSMSRLGAALTRGFIAISVLNRAIGYGVLARFVARFDGRAGLWRDVLGRWREWIGGT